MFFIISKIGFYHEIGRDIFPDGEIIFGFAYWRAPLRPGTLSLIPSVTLTTGLLGWCAVWSLCLEILQSLFEHI